MKPLRSGKEAKMWVALSLSSPAEVGEERLLCSCSGWERLKLDRGRSLFSLARILCLLVNVCVVRGCPAGLTSVLSCRPFKLAFQTNILSMSENTLKWPREVAHTAAQRGCAGPVVFHCGLPRPWSLRFDWSEFASALHLCWFCICAKYSPDEGQRLGLCLYR